MTDYLDYVHLYENTHVTYGRGHFLGRILYDVQSEQHTSMPTMLFSDLGCDVTSFSSMHP